jgi:hypothetical protein
LDCPSDDPEGGVAGNGRILDEKRLRAVEEKYLPD